MLTTRGMEAVRAIEILYILWDGTVGGAAANLADFLRNVSRDRYQVTLCLLSRGGASSDALADLGARVVEIRATSGRDFRAYLRFMRFLRCELFDLIHNNSITPFGHPALLLAARQTPRLYQEHGDIHTAGQEGKAALFYRLFKRAYPAFLTVSEETMQRMQDLGVPGHRITNVGNPVDCAHFTPALPRASARLDIGLSPAGPLIGTACRFVPEKDLPLFLEAARIIRSRVPEARFVLAGEGSEEPRLRGLVRELDLGGVTRFLPVQVNMPRFFRAMDVFMVTSQSESFGRAVLESLACATPVVAVVPSRGGGRDIVRMADGVLRTHEREADALADLVTRAVGDRDERERLGEAGRRWVLRQREYQVGEWIRRLEAGYAALLNPGARNGSMRG